MTGYGSSDYLTERFSLVVEVKSYNNRYLDLQINAPAYLSGFDQELRQQVRNRIARGHVDVNIRMKILEADVAMHVDRPLVRKLREAFRVIAEEAEITDPPALSNFLQHEDVLKMVQLPDADEYHDPVVQHLAIALEQCVAARRVEGSATEEDIRAQLANFSTAFTVVTEQADTLEQSLRTTLVDRFEALVGEAYDEQRILQEVAVMLNRYTVGEELQRVTSHLQQFARMLDTDEPVGKKLDFLCQELNREINTIASKSTMAVINQAVVAMKDSLENIREQLRNIE